MTVREIAEALGVRVGYLLDAANPDREDVQFQARLLGRLAKVTGNDRAIHYIAQMSGGLFVRLPERIGGEDPIMLDHLTAICGKFAKKIDTIRLAVADRNITVDEAGLIARDGSELIASVIAAVHAAHELAGIPHDQLDLVKL
jgi:hypothetical protein